MNRFQTYIAAYGRELTLKFNRTRSTLTDSDVKGGRNEMIVAEFLRQHVAAYFVTTGVQLIDAHDRISNEVDVTVCNRDQPFRESIEGILIAEGVDFCVQVKANLNSNELRRAIRNCSSVKQLTRTFTTGDETIQPIGVSKVNMARVPYITLAFSTSIAEDTLHEKLIAESDTVSSYEQMDALFVIDQGLSFLNFRDGMDRGWKNAGKPIRGWLKIESGDQTMLEVLRYVNTQVPRFRRLLSPIIHYFPMDPDYKMRGAT